MQRDRSPWNVIAPRVADWSCSMKRSPAMPSIDGILEDAVRGGCCRFICVAQYVPSITGLQACCATTTGECVVKKSATREV